MYRAMGMRPPPHGTLQAARIAAALQLDARQLCAQALAEFHPSVYAALFGPDAAPANTQQVAA
jgi:hypothetical protein